MSNRRFDQRTHECPAMSNVLKEATWFINPEVVEGLQNFGVFSQLCKYALGM